MNISEGLVESGIKAFFLTLIVFSVADVAVVVHGFVAWRCCVKSMLCYYSFCVLLFSLTRYSVRSFISCLPLKRSSTKHAAQSNRPKGHKAQMSMLPKKAETYVDINFFIFAFIEVNTVLFLFFSRCKT